MGLSTSLTGRLRNINLPKTHGLFPLFEAVVNSIHAIDERVEKDNKIDLSLCKIKIKILRSPQINSEDTNKPEIIGFEVEDNGIGFTEENFNSFQTLDSEYKIKIGGRGVGRLLWLKAFSKVTIKSTFNQGSEIHSRFFEFNQKNDINNHSIEIVGDKNPISTIVQLEQIKKDYQKYLPKTTQSIASAILEHCLWYFLREGSAPNIIIEDEDDSISLNKEYDSYMLSKSKTIQFQINTSIFDLTHIKIKSVSYNKHSITYIAANRPVCEENLSGKIAGLFGALNDGEDKFYYLCFISSTFLDENVNEERLGFNIPENHGSLIPKDEISFSELRLKIIEYVKDYLNTFLEESKKLSEEKVTQFINTKAPRYRPIWNRIDDDEKIFDPNISDKELELKLHSHLVTIESQLIAEGHDLMNPSDSEDEDDYSKRIADYLSKANDMKKSDLANYVTHRKVILDILGNAIMLQKSGKYSKEEVIHKLIMPMQKDSTEVFADETNLWLIDERLAFHNYLASDRSIKSMPITDSNSDKEPDLLALNIYDNPILVNDGQALPLASITVVEIKRPMRNDAKEGEEKNPIEQALNYLKRVRSGTVKTHTGRPIPDSENVPGFCYIIADITDSIKERCEYLDLRVTSDKLGYFGYHKQFNTYIEVISFDRLINAAKERNRAFFDKLGLPSN